MLESIEDREIKLLWMQEELSKFGEATVDMLVDKIASLKMNRTGSLSSSFSHGPFMDGDNPGERLYFNTYGRFVDIQAYSDHKTRVNINRVVWGMKENRRRQKKWYAKNMYKLLSKLQSRVMYCLTEEELARLKGILMNRKK